MPTSKLDKTLYWISTGLVLLMMAWSVVSYIFMHDFMSGFFVKMGYPTYIMYPLAGLKLVAIVVIVTNRYKDLKDMAYAAYYITMVFATAAPLSVGDTPYHAFVGLIAVPLSYIYSNRVRGKPARDLLQF